jgi:hypothetical protein
MARMSAFNFAAGQVWRAFGHASLRLVKYGTHVGILTLRLGKYGTHLGMQVCGLACNELGRVDYARRVVVPAVCFVTAFAVDFENPSVGNVSAVTRRQNVY